LLQASGQTALAEPLKNVRVDPCWTLMLAYPQAVQPGLITLGPQWNAARSTHHRIAWMARESSKPGRERIERWTVQASAPWSAEHVNDTPDRIKGKLVKAFAEITGIRVTPAHAEVHRWLYAKTGQPLGQSFLWSQAQGIGLCGDWCLGHRVEDAFVSGLELALACDMIVCAESARLGQPEVNLGIIPGFGGTQRLIHRCGIGQARRLCYTADLLSASEAHTIGLADKIFPEAQFFEQVQTLAELIASKAPLAVQGAKRVINRSQDTALLSGLRLEVEEFLKLFGTADREEGMDAFIQKRKPSFTGR
jgi:hypothetical protein